MTNIIFFVDYLGNLTTAMTLGAIFLFILLLVMIVTAGYVSSVRNAKVSLLPKEDIFLLEISRWLFPLSELCFPYHSAKNGLRNKLVYKFHSQTGDKVQRLGFREPDRTTDEASSEFIDRYIKKCMEYPDIDQAVKLEPIPLNNFIKDIVDKILLTRHVNNLSVYMDVDDQLCIISDKKKLAYFLSDFIQCAIDRRDPTKPLGYLKITSRSNDPNVSVVFSDNGLGFATEDISSIFPVLKEARHQLKKADMGSFLLKAFAKRINVQLNIVSEEGEGTMFVFDFEGKSSGMSNSSSLQMLNK